MQSRDAQLTSYQPGEAELLATVGGHDLAKRSRYFTFKLKAVFISVSCV